MADLDQVLGAVLASLAQARRMADEQTTAIAQYYQTSPLLKGMSAPRIRLPEVTVDVPVIIDQLEAGKPPVFASPKELAALAVDAAVRTAQSADVPMSAAVRDSLSAAIRARMDAVMGQLDVGKAAPELVQESLAATVDEALHAPVGKVISARVATLSKLAAQAAARAAVQASTKATGKTTVRATTDAARAAGLAAASAPSAIAVPQATVVQASVLAAAKEAIRLAAIKEPGRAATLKTSVLTADIKERASPETITRLKLVLREEGMEWQEVRQANGSTTAMLTPE